MVGGVIVGGGLCDWRWWAVDGGWLGYCGLWVVGGLWLVVGGVVVHGGWWMVGGGWWVVGGVVIGGGWWLVRL